MEKKLENIVYKKQFTYILKLQIRISGKSGGIKFEGYSLKRNLRLKGDF